MFKSIGLLLLLATICCTAGGQVIAKVVVYEIPAGVETYVPVTRDDIEERAFKVVSLKNDKQASEAIALIHETHEAFDPKRIRVKIVKGDESYVFDANGIGVSSSGKSVAIDISQLTVVLSK
jgi:hypothetical protein